MDVPNVLDTAALINWPIELLDGGYVVENQRLELSRVSPERMLSLEAANLIWKRPTIESINQATKISIDTGDLDEAGAAELFGSTAGFKTSEPNVTPDTTPSSVELEDDF